MQPVIHPTLRSRKWSYFGPLVSGVFIQDVLIGFSHYGSKPENIGAHDIRFRKDSVSLPAEVLAARQKMYIFAEGESSLRT